MKINIYFLVFFLFICTEEIDAQRKRVVEAIKPIESTLFDSLKFRNIGPAFMSGRIADIAIDPTNENVWYVAAGSGGIWKTVNSGTTFQPIFTDQTVYSMGCITIDPNDPNIVWAGTGENVGGRHVGFGDGIYKSEDGGNTWMQMGLRRSEHISKIIIHPNNSDIIMVASQGPLWNKGGERGFFLSKDGGNTWKKTLGDEAWTGVTDVVMDSRTPERLYAATWQHHRTVAAWMGGGEKSGIHLSKDGGETWKKLTTGLPKGKMGKIGLAISPINPDIVYAAIELNRITGGVWRSANRGGSWTKMSNAVAGATGPHYYQEIYASPHKLDRLYLMNNRLMKSEDGGKTFANMDETAKHGDNHSVTFKANDPNYLLIGTDGGVYESFDLGNTWRYMQNLPLTQFYKVAVDDDVPFYNIYGGTQDNSTEGGPSRTDNVHGIRNADWSVVLNWDGHQPATEPGNPNILYAERQQGNLSRVDMITGEVIDIQPQPKEKEPFERFNWDAPILVSPHNSTTIFFGSQRVWKSENRGDSWTAISGDLTKNQERISLPIMGKIQSWDAPWDINAMSNYNTITSLAQSPIDEQMIYVGTDDGLLQITENGGQTWKRIGVGQMGVPATSFINDVKADLFDANTVYVALDNHKFGDYKPYLLKSTDKGTTWTSIANGIKDKHLVWRVVQDHKNKNLLFVGTELGLFFTVDGGKSWTELNGGVPTISFRDLAIQRRENDLVAASFGYGFFILDDYSALREVSSELLNQKAALFSPRKAWWYIPRSVLSFDNKRGSQGSQLYVAPNPDFGAIFTYYLKNEYLTEKKIRQEREKEMQGDIPFPGWEALERETREQKVLVFLEITNETGKVLNRVVATNKKGFNRVSWDLTVGSPNIIKLNDDPKHNQNGLMVAPGNYSATLYKLQKGKVVQLTEPVTVEVTPLRKGALQGANPQTVTNFWREYEQMTREVDILSTRLSNTRKTAKQLKTAALRTNVNNKMFEQIVQVINELDAADTQLNGNPAKNEIGEKTNPTLGFRLFQLNKGITRSTYGPTETHKEIVGIIKKEWSKMNMRVNDLAKKVATLSKQIKDAGGPWIEGQE